jgi:hypothetical protein
MTISRRRFVGGVAGAGVASVTAAHVVLAPSEPIRIGLLAATMGPLTSDEAAFLKCPVSSRDYPPATNLEL